MRNIRPIIYFANFDCIDFLAYQLWLKMKLPPLIRITSESQHYNLLIKIYAQFHFSYFRSVVYNPESKIMEGTAMQISDLLLQTTNLELNLRSIVF